MLRAAAAAAAVDDVDDVDDRMCCGDVCAKIGEYYKQNAHDDDVNSKRPAAAAYAAAVLR